MIVIKDGKAVEVRVTGGGVREELFAATILLGDRPGDGVDNRYLWGEYKDGDVAEFEYDSESHTLAGRKVDLSGVEATLAVERLGGFVYFDEG